MIVKYDRSGMDVLRFVVPASAAKPEAKVPFSQAKLAHYNHLMDRDLPGGAWFRHQARLTQTELRIAPNTVQTQRFPQTSRRDDFSASYDLFTGGRAISENLQLDRAMPVRPANETPVKIDSHRAASRSRRSTGNRWSRTLSPSSIRWPARYPSTSMRSSSPVSRRRWPWPTRPSSHDTPVLRLAQPRAEDAGVVQRYERQLGLPLSTLARLIGPSLVKSVALTGSDPSFPLGTDVAVLLETDQSGRLGELAPGRRRVGGHRDSRRQRFRRRDRAGLPIPGFASPDRKMSSYVAALDGAVVVTNSTYQLSGWRPSVNGKSQVPCRAARIQVLPHPLSPRRQPRSRP